MKRSALHTSPGMCVHVEFCVVCSCVQNLLCLYSIYSNTAQLQWHTMHTCIVCVCVDLHHPWLCQLLHLRSVSCCFGLNPSCRPASPQRRSNTVFPLNQMKKVKRRTWLPEPEGSARTPRTSHRFPVIQHNKRWHLGTRNYYHIITERLFLHKNTMRAESSE